MDREPLVDGGAAGLRTMAKLLRKGGFPVEALYLIRRIDIENFTDWTIVAVMNPFRPGVDRDFIYEVVRLRREGRLPKIDGDVSFSAVPPDNVEASRLLEYSRKMSPAPSVLRNVIFRGLAIDYAVLAVDEGSRVVAA